MAADGGKPSTAGEVLFMPSVAHPVIWNLDLRRSAGPRVVPLASVSWWRVRQRVVEAAGAALAIGAVATVLRVVGGVSGAW